MPPNMRVMRIALEPYFALDDHFEDIFAEAQLRQGILSKVASARGGA